MGPGLLATGYPPWRHCTSSSNPSTPSPRRENRHRLAEFVGVSLAICYFTTARCGWTGLCESRKAATACWRSPRPRHLHDRLERNVTSWTSGAERLGYSDSKYSARIPPYSHARRLQAGKPNRSWLGRGEGRAKTNGGTSARTVAVLATGFVNSVKDDAGNLRGFIKVCGHHPPQAGRRERDRFFRSVPTCWWSPGLTVTSSKLPDWERTLGWTPDELKSHPWLFLSIPTTRKRRVPKLVIMQGHETVRFRNRYRCKDGSYRWLA